MPKAIDLTNQRFGRLVAIERAGSNPVRWRCICDCGNERVATRCHLRNGDTRSCGCLNREAHTKHGMCDTAVYHVWQAMIARCRNPNNKHYSNYGGRGISVCDRWLSFKSFYEDMGSNYEPGLEIDRINNNAGYYSENCRWISRQTNSNNRRNNRWINTPSGQMTLAQAARAYEIHLGTLSSRLNRSKWPLEKALTTPVK